ncbi:MAG: hypothetical protein ACI4MH_05900 [Candidatus Coproplasma sp.]
MNKNIAYGRWLKGIVCAILVCAFLLTFTLSDYYIFNRIGQFNILFVLSQWIKKAGFLLLPLAVFYKKRCCADIAKYVLPPFVVISCFTFGEFFDVTKTAQTPAQEIYNSINLFMPKWLNITLFFAQSGLILAACALLFLQDGLKANPKSFCWLLPAVIAVMPLNIFENFFDISSVPADSFLRFHNFTVWHFLALASLVGVTIALYFFLRHKSDRSRDEFLAAVAITLLIQYHSKDSMVLGDGYNVYHTIFACIPLFICNIGVYVASLSVLIKKKTLYEISFFVHAVGALSVFVYFGRDDMSDYGIFCSRSILYFCLTHVLLFALSVLPSALGQYKFKMRDCVVPLIYYFVVIILASVCSALVTSASMGWHTQDGYYLSPDELLYPNYAFTQINPLPFTVPPIVTLTVWRYEINVLYVLGLYAVYVGLFFSFTGLYYAFLALRKKYFARRIYAGELNPDVNSASVSDQALSEDGQTEAKKEAAATDEEN